MSLRRERMLKKHFKNDSSEEKKNFTIAMKCFENVL
jgi:hypothetical protein